MWNTVVRIVEGSVQHKNAEQGHLNSGLKKLRKYTWGIIWKNGILGIRPEEQEAAWLGAMSIGTLHQLSLESSEDRPGRLCQGEK